MYRVTVLIVSALVACGSISCRKTWNSKLGIPSEVYQQNTFGVHVDESRGETLLIVPRATSAGRFAVVESSVFALENADARAYRVRGITPHAALKAGPITQEPQFFDTLGESLAAAGVHGITTADGVQWYGESPGGPATIVALDPSLIESDVVDLVSGVGTFGGTASWFGEQPPEGHLVVVEGSSLNARPTVARLGREAQVIKPGWTTNVSGKLPPNDRYLYSAKAAPLARRAGGELYVTIWNDRVYIGSTDPIQSGGIPYLVGSAPLGVGGTATEVASELRGFQALLRGKPLAAVGFFDADDLDIHGSNLAAQIGLMELLAQGGYMSLVDRRLRATGPNEGVRRAVRARMMFRTGDAGARAEAAKAFEELLMATSSSALQAQGSTAFLVARIDASNGHWNTASAVAGQAAQKFKASGDAIRAAEAELFAGEAALMAGDTARGVEFATRARNRFYQGKSPYLSALAEVSLSYVYARGGNSGEAEKMADYARRRFAAWNDPVATNRADVALASISANAVALRSGFELALEQSDHIAALDAATALVQREGVPTGDERLTLAVAVARGFPHVIEPLRRVTAGSVATKLCVSRGEWLASIKPDDAELVSAMCGASVDLASITKAPPVSATTIYQKLIRGEYASASRMLGEVGDEQSLDFDAAATLAMARHLVEGKTAESVHGSAMKATQALDAASRWSALNAQADRAERAGAHGLASLWGADAIDAVKAANLDSPASVRAEVARQHAARLVRMGRPIDASNAASRALVGMVAVESGEKRATAVLAGYGAIAAATAGANSDVKELQTAANASLEGLPPFDLAEAETSLAWYAASNGQLEMSKAWSKRARKTLKMLTPEERTATMVARLAAADAFAARDEGNDNAAFKSVSIWFDNPGDDPDVATDLWTLALDSAPNAGLREGFVKRLQNAELAGAAAAVVVRHQLERGRVTEAVELSGGRDLGANPTSRLNLGVRLAVLNGSASNAHVIRLSQTTRSFEIGLLATQLSDSPAKAVAEWARATQTNRGISTTERKRAELLLGMSTFKVPNPRRTTKYQEVLEQALEARNADSVVAAVVERVDDLITTGRAGAAETVLERNAAWFAKTEPESSAELAGLKLAVNLGQLDLVNANRLGQVSPAETDTGAAARFHLLAAKSHFALGLNAAGEQAVLKAAALARTSKARALIKDVETLAKTFDVEIDR